ncbi:GDNF family receptor alpha-4-like [Pelodytes ibericus]
MMGCKCKRHMKKEEHCLNVYWTVHPVNVQSYRDLDNSPYEDNEHDIEKTTEYTMDNEKSLTDSDVYKSSDNDCLKHSNICSLHDKCSRNKHAYVNQCSVLNDDGKCERRKCHQSLRQFFKKVPLEFTKRMLFCSCADSNCAERRRKVIVPECSFEEESKPNCLQLHHSCMNDDLCKSRFADYQKHCHAFDKRARNCPKEHYNLCIHTYTRMIGTIMTPNFVSNTSIKLSLWCTCESSGNQQDDCKTIQEMFTSSMCLKNAIKSELGENIEMDDTQTISRVQIHEEDTDLSVLYRANQVAEKNKRPGTTGDEDTGNAKINRSNNTASGVSCPSLAVTLLSPGLLLWFLKTYQGVQHAEVRPAGKLITASCTTFKLDAAFPERTLPNI